MTEQMFTLIIYVSLFRAPPCIDLSGRGGVFAPPRTKVNLARVLVDVDRLVQLQRRILRGLILAGLRASVNLARVFVDVAGRVGFLDVVAAVVRSLPGAAGVLSEHDAVPDRVVPRLRRLRVAEVDERDVDALPRRGAQQPRAPGRAGARAVRDGARQVPAAAAHVDLESSMSGTAT